MPRPLFDSEYIHGLHDRGGEPLMLDQGKPGWVLVTEAIGCNPDDGGGADYRGLSDRGLGVIARLNNGYYPSGTIPHSSRYADFARRCARFVAASPGCKTWLIGNEMNFVVERPAVPGRDLPRDLPPADDPFYHASPDRFNVLSHGETRGGPEDTAPSRGLEQPGSETITPELYARCLKLCREAIRAVPGHGDDLVLVGAAAPWNNQTSYPGNPTGDWVKYMTDILTCLGPGGCDGIAVHTYTHGADAALVESEERLGAPDFRQYHYHFRTYRDFMGGVPANMRHLPVFITEADQDVSWDDRPNDWIQRAHREIDAWNRQPGNQQIRALILYRWSRDDKWCLQDRGHVAEDFRQAVALGLRWRAVAAGPPPPAWRPGDTLTAQANAKLRRTPGFQAKPDADVLEVVAQGGRMTLLIGGPKDVDGLRWWPVRRTAAAGAVLEGWIAETAPTGEPLLLKSGEAPPFALNEQVQNIATTNANLRAEPGGSIQTTVPSGGLVTVTGAARAQGQLQWWPVRFVAPGGGAVTGWMAERAGDGTPLLASTACLTAGGARTPG
jgi:hypothetical protein